jgi:hypothetical protein
MRKYFIIILFIFLYGCSVEPEQVEKTSNQNIKLDFLFEKDGCKVYRFSDRGQYVYWTNCRGNITSYHLNGKVTSKFQNETIIRDEND